MALVLTATGLFLYFRLAAELNNSIDEGLRSRADEVSALVRQSPSALRESTGGSRLSEQDESFAQVVDRSGDVVDYSSPNRAGALLTADELGRAETQTILIEAERIPGINNEARLLATPVQAQAQGLIVVVGTSLEDRNDALGSLKALLLIGGPVALVLASLAGYWVTSASLLPVERMRRRAAVVSATEPNQRLPVPPTNDEIGRLGQTLNEMLGRLEAALNRERTFVSEASHELRTPLAILKTELELALRKGRSRSELEEALSSAAEETDRLAQLAEDLLVIARSDQGQLPVRVTPVEAGEILADVRERFAIRGRETNRDLLAEPAEGIRLTADPLRLRQALGNMVDNALRYGEGTVRLSAFASNGHVELHVLDDGPGFPPEFLGVAFERFTRADEGRARGGTGLGLAIVEAIAKAHQGNARAANRPGGGADVWLTLPIKPD
jgi:two-component system OmpR family sensor kinase